VSDARYDAAVSTLKSIHQLALARDPSVLEIHAILEAREEVLRRYQPVFAPENLPKLTEEEFRSFLHFKNNRHWVSLQRLGPRICKDMKRLREALAILLDESQPIRDRLNTLVSAPRGSFLPGLGKAVLTPILMVCHPDRYGVWNLVTELSMKKVDLWPEFEKGQPFGERYENVNEILLRLAADLGVDLWTLDALWWRIEILSVGEREREADEESTDPVERAARFGLERHLQEFLRDNWETTELAKEWVIFEEDGDPEAGCEYPCPVGRIDLLARHRKEPRWLVVELKRGQSSDQTVGQVLRYMGWVQRELADAGEQVEGLVIAQAADEGLRYAITAAGRVRLMLYKVDFQLREPGA
jgi:hypothetical protein